MKIGVSLKIDVSKIDKNRLITIFPNPARNYFEIIINLQIESIIFNIYSVFGRLVDSGIWTQRTNKYNCRYLAPGFYVIQIQFNGQLLNYRLIIE